MFTWSALTRLESLLSDVSRKISISERPGMGDWEMQWRELKQSEVNSLAGSCSQANVFK